MNLNDRIGQWLIDLRQRSGTLASKCELAGRPIVTLSYAQTWDGSITTVPGNTLALSSQASKAMTHALRSWHDGILIGIGTLVADDPLLTVRESRGANPQPIVLDSKQRFPADSKVCRENDRKPWVLSNSKLENDQINYEQIVVGSDKRGRVDLELAMEAIHARGIKTLMVEGGADVISSFLAARLADAIILTIAPMLVGGYKAVNTLIGDTSFPRIAALNSHQQGDEMILWGEIDYQDKPNGE